MTFPKIKIKLTRAPSEWEPTGPRINADKQPDVCACGYRWTMVENTGTGERLCYACLSKRLELPAGY